jgi:hypothetical protein
MRIVQHKWLGPLQRIVIAIPQVGSKKKVLITSEKWFTYEAAVGTGYSIFSVTGD